MSDTRIKALISFSDGTISMYAGEVRNVDSTKASAFISGGLAVAYTDPINPSGSVTLDANGTYNVTDKATAVVNVSLVTLQYNANGGSGSVDNVVTASGNSVSLNDGSGLTAPSHKAFKGWGLTADATEVLTSPYTITENKTLYAIYEVTEYVITYNVNGGSGTVSPTVVTVGESTTLDAGSGITPPTNKTFKGWGDSATATEVIESPYTPTEDVTLYAVYAEE